MKLKKTLILFVLLVILGSVAYLLERPAKTITTPVQLFPEFSVEAVSSIEIINKEDKTILVKSADGWKVENEQGFPVDPELIKKTLESIGELKKANNVVSDNPDNQKLFEVDPNQGIEVKVSDQGKKMLANFLVGKTGPDFMSTYLRKAGSNEVILGEGYHLRSSFTRTAKNWYDLNIFNIPSDQVTGFEIINQDKKLALKKEQDQWQITDPNQAPAQKNLADDLANTLARLRASDLVKAEQLEEYELAAPQKTLAVTLADGTQQRLNIGKKNDRNQYYVKTDKEVIYLVSQYNIDKFNKTFEELKEIKPQEESKEGQPSELNLPPGMSPGMPPGPGMSPKMPPGMPPGPGMSPRMPPGMPPGPGMSPKMPPGMPPVQNKGGKP